LVFEMVFETVFVVAAVLAGAILVMSIASGKAIEALRWSPPTIVSRAEDPRKYWAGIWAETVVFGALAWAAVQIVFY
jgi:hypothetical protein